MKLEWHTKSFAFTGLDPFVADLLRKLPGCASVDDEAAAARIFPPPTSGEEEELDADWRDHVAPELKELFASHVDTVVADLARLKLRKPKKPAEGEEKADAEEEQGEGLTVPATHVNAWIHTLNQARLALGERHAMTERHLNHGELPENEGDAMAVVQVEFYGYMLAFLLRHTDL